MGLNALVCLGNKGCRRAITSKWGLGLLLSWQHRSLSIKKQKTTVLPKDENVKQDSTKYNKGSSGLGRSCHVVRTTTSRILQIQRKIRDILTHECSWKMKKSLTCSTANGNKDLESDWSDCSSTHGNALNDLTRVIFFKYTFPLPYLFDCRTYKFWFETP